MDFYKLILHWFGPGLLARHADVQEDGFVTKFGHRRRIDKVHEGHVRLADVVDGQEDLQKHFDANFVFLRMYRFAIQLLNVALHENMQIALFQMLGF